MKRSECARDMAVIGNGCVRDRKTPWFLRFPLLLLLAVSNVPAKAETGKAVLEHAEVCLQEAEELRQNVSRAEDGSFIGRSGDRFFASDVHVPDERPDQMAGTIPFWNVQPTGQRFEAVALGPANRWGLVPAFILIYLDGTAQLYQEQVLLNGAALFAPQHASGPCADLLRRAEAEARRQKAGLWADKRVANIFSTAAPKRLEGQSGRYVIARGRVVSLGKTRSTRYLNFGAYWKTDFTGILKVSDEDRFNAALSRFGASLDELAGTTVELRGILEERDGPLISLRHPEQLLVLETERVERAGR